MARWFLLLLLLSSALCLRHSTTAIFATSLASSGDDYKWLTSIMRAGHGGDRQELPGAPPMSFGPNISVCHPSFTDAGVPVNCCPPPPGALPEDVIDFELPDLSGVPLRVRRPAHLAFLDDNYVEKYRRAVAAMKALPPTHPHSWVRQANTHCLYCTGSYLQVNSEHLFKVHRSWYFFPWHRAFLYFHERIMAKLADDESFALPYWQWDHPDGMHLPDIYLNGSLAHRNRDITHLPPAVSDNNYASLERGLSPPEQIMYNMAFMYTQMVSSAGKPELFMGCRLRPGEEDMCDGPGTIEMAPHNTLHDWVGAGCNPEREDMGAFYSAARDPVFYAHHGNIDRLWTVWKELHDSRPEIVDNVWLNTHFYFYDENLVLNRVKVRDILNVGKLGYQYEKTELPWLGARPQPAVDPAVARKVLARRGRGGSARMQWFGGSKGIALNGTITVKVPRSSRLRRELREEDSEEEVLVVYGIERKDDVYCKFSVYINVADEATVVAAGARAREFAGTFVGIRRGVRRGEENAKTTLKLGISELLRDLGAAEDESIWVSLVPEVAGRKVVVGGVRIEYMGW